jgi:hypothetical protein
MEGLPVDVQRIILRMIGPPRFTFHLRSLFRVDKRWRGWVARYICDTIDIDWFVLCLTRRLVHLKNTEIVEWNVFENLKKQWSKTPALLPSFVMHLDYEFGIQKRFVPLFWSKDSILKDLKRKNMEKGVLKIQIRGIETEEGLVERYAAQTKSHEYSLQKHREKRDASEATLHELEQKWTKKSKL